LTIHADWSWWTYFLVGGDVITRGQIVDYDMASRSITYLKRNANDPKLNPNKIGTPEFEAWNWDRNAGTFDAVWIDPKQSIVLSVDDFSQLERGLKPDSFVELTGQDPKDQFSDEFNTLSSHLPPELQEWLRKRKPDEGARST
jgi:hypothetical protein